MRNSWVISGSLTLLIAALGLKLTSSIPFQDIEMGLGAAFFPCLVLIVLIFLGLYALIYGIFIRKNIGGKKSDKRYYLSTAFVIILLIAYIIFFEPIGFLLSTFLFLVGTMALCGTKWWLTPIIAALITGGLYTIFAIFFNVALP